MIRVITLNAGLLRIEFLWGLKVLEPAPWVAERLARLPAILRDHPADILFLQEVYRAEHKAFIAERLADLYPHAAYSRDTPKLRLLPDSLMILSRFPLAGSSFTRFDAGRWDERLLDTKGFLCAQAEIPSWGRVLLANVHTTAGVFTHPEDKRVDAVREAQLNQLARQVRQRDVQVRTRILAGDFNCGPPASVGNYELLSTRGYTDSFAALGLAERPTWSPTANALNRGGEHASWGCPPQRIDHVFVEKASVRPVAGGVFLEDEAVRVADGLSVPVSDHYGYWVDLEEAVFEAPAERR